MNNIDIQLLSETISFLNSINHPDYLRIAKEIIMYSNGDKKVIKEIEERLSKDEPWEYIKGESEFCGLKIAVNRDVLIPRVETEQIIEIAKTFNKKFQNIIDVGCGSGAISIALAKIFPKIDITGIDIDEKALGIARLNAKNNKVDLKFIQSDLLSNISITSPTLVVANLPYIPTEEIGKLQTSVKNFEPIIALDGGKDGLMLILRLLDQIKDNKRVIGAILEIDPSQKEKLEEKIKGFKYEFINDSF